MGAPVLRVVVHFPLQNLTRIPREVPGVELIQAPTEGDPPADVAGEVLLAHPGATNVRELAERGVRWIHSFGTGIDRFPLDAVGDRILTCARGVSAVPISEWVLAMLLAFEKQLPDAWIQAPPESWYWAQLGTLHGKTLGLVGVGGIGTAVAERARPFGMRVRAVRRTRRPAPPGVELARDLEDLLASADHLVIAAPATAATHHLIGRKALARVKPGAHLVNIARGSLVDPDPLREALDDGRLARASLDAVEPEPLPEGHWLYTHPRVCLSPHLSWSMPGAYDRVLDFFIDNLRRYRDGRPLAGVVDPEAAY